MPTDLEVYEKAIRVVAPCKTLDQLTTATNYCSLAIKHFGNSKDSMASVYAYGTTLVKIVEAKRKQLLANEYTYEVTKRQKRVLQ